MSVMNYTILINKYCKFLGLDVFKKKKQTFALILPCKDADNNGEKQLFLRNTKVCPWGS